MKKNIVFAGLLWGATAQVCAGPWIAAGDMQLRHHIQLLHDHDVIKTPVNSWPLNWANIKRDLALVDKGNIPSSIEWSYRYVFFESERQTSVFNNSIKNSVATSVPVFNDFDDSAREADELTVQIDALVGLFSINVQGSQISDPFDEDSSRLDGTAISALLGNWALGVGAVDRWWGPGWQSSLSLSNYARPAPGVFLRRNYDDGFDHPWLKWLGSWQLEVFLNQLQGERSVDLPHMYGARFSWNLASFLELGYSASGFSGADQELIDSNQRGWSEKLIAVDGRASARFLGGVHGIYAQLMGTAEGGPIPENNIGLVGYDFAFSLKGLSSRINIEYSNTTSGALTGDETFGQTYSDNTYQTGYTHYGRVMGSAFGGDAETLTLSGQHYHMNGWEWSWKLTTAELNKNDQSEFSISEQVVERNYMDIGVGKVLSNHLKVNAKAFYLDSTLEYFDEQVESGLAVSLHYRY